MMTILKPFGALLLLSGTTSACSNVKLTYEREGSGHVSARTMDWGSDLESAVTTFPRGTPLKRYPTGSNAPSTAVAGRATADIGFVGVEVKAIGDLIPDGLNEYGFGVALLWLEHPAKLQTTPGMDVLKGDPAWDATEFGDYYPSFNSTDPRPAMPTLDLPGQLLSSCKTVKEAKALIRGYQIVATDGSMFPSYLNFCSSTRECNPGIHFSLHDAEGHSAVVEFIGEASKATSPNCFSDPAIGGTAAPNGARVCIYDTTDNGVLVNEPNLETQQRLLQKQMQQKTDSNDGLFSMLQNEFGGYSPISRYSRLSVLNILGERASPTCASSASCGWSDTKYLTNADKLQNPHGFSFESSNPAVDRITQAARQIATVARPYGINVVGNTQYGATQWTVIRDHTNKRFLFKSPATPNFRSVNLSSLSLDQKGPKRSMPLANQAFDFDDVSADLVVVPTSKRTLRGFA